MFDAVFNRFHVAKHHRGAGIEAEPMGDVHDFQPVVAHGFERGNALAHAVHEDFAAAAGNGAESGRLKSRMIFSSGSLKTSRKWTNSLGLKPWMLICGNLFLCARAGRDTIAW